MRRYKYITFSDRKQIAELYRSNARPADIAERLGVTTATIYRELKRGETAGEDGAPVLDRNKRRAYNPVIAQQTVQENIRRRGGPRRTTCKEGLTVTQFEKITQSPETLGALLADLPVIHGPWDTEFQTRFCAGCAAENCDACPHAAERNSPGWWLNLESGDGCLDRYAAIVTYHNGAVTGAVVEAESQGGAWRKLFTMFKPEIIASASLSMILTPERGGHDKT